MLDHLCRQRTKNSPLAGPLAGSAERCVRGQPSSTAGQELRVFDGFADFLKRGLRVRDAWREVFAREPITTVLSADEYNPYTRLPILLARSRKLRTVFCDHGALNMSFGIRRPVLTPI